MMKAIALLALLIPSFAFSWTLNTNFGASFKTNEVKVFIDNNTACDKNHITTGELQALVESAVDNFWNKVPTSALHLSFGGFSTGIAAMSDGRLCSPTDNACITQGSSDPAGVIPAVDNIVIACNENPKNFDNSDNVLAVTIPVKFSGKKIAGSVIIINDVSDPAKFGQLSRNDQISVIAHEIGHALGLGHSKNSAALMYYRTVDLRTNLGQDDIDGISYLYPMKGDLYGLSKEGILGGVCATITPYEDNTKGGPPFLQMGAGLFIMILMFEILRLFKSAKRSSTF